MRAAMALLLCACGSTGECGRSVDCPGDEGSGVCLEDLERAERYCTTGCPAVSSPYLDECPAGRACVTGESNDAEGICIERIGTCADAERCGNGLDDDCDGATDGAPCEPITCYTDLMCGEVRAFACVRDADGSTRHCGALLRERNVGAPCADPSDCYNAHCSYGYCGEACGPIGDPCDGGDGWCLPDESGLLVCVRDCRIGCREGQICRPFFIYCDNPDDPSCYVAACAR